MGLPLIVPPSRVMVPPVAIVIPAPLEKDPDVKLRLVMVILEVVAKVSAALLSVRVPSVVPVNPISEGKAPVPSTIIEDELVAESAAGVAGP